MCSLEGAPACARSQFTSRLSRWLHAMYSADQQELDICITISSDVLMQEHSTRKLGRQEYREPGVQHCSLRHSEAPIVIRVCSSSITREYSWQTSRSHFVTRNICGECLPLPRDPSTLSEGSDGYWAELRPRAPAAA